MAVVAAAGMVVAVVEATAGVAVVAVTAATAGPATRRCPSQAEQGWEERLIMMRQPGRGLRVSLTSCHHGRACRAFLKADPSANSLCSAKLGFPFARRLIRVHSDESGGPAVIQTQAPQTTDRDETARLQKPPTTFRVDPLAPLSVQQEDLTEDRWRQAQLEEPERWDGMS